MQINKKKHISPIIGLYLGLQFGAMSELFETFQIGCDRMTNLYVHVFITNQKSTFNLKIKCFKKNVIGYFEQQK